MLYLAKFYYKFGISSNKIKIIGWLLFNLFIQVDEDTKLYFALNFHGFYCCTCSISIHYYVAIHILE